MSFSPHACVRIGITTWNHWDCTNGGCPFHESFQKWIVSPLFTCQVIYVVTTSLEDIMKFHIAEPFGGLAMVRILKRLEESKYLACMIWHHLALGLEYIFQTNFPPNALFRLVRSCRPTPPISFLCDILVRGINGIFFSWDKLPVHKKLLMIFSICTITDFGALRIEI